MVEVEERGLGTFEHDLVTGVECLVHEPHRIADHRRQSGGDLARYLAAISSPSSGRRLYTLARTAFFSLNTTSSFWRKIFGSKRSCTRKPMRAALSA